MNEPRIEKEADLKCPGCGDVPYVLYRRQHTHENGIPYESWENVLWPAKEGVMPPKDSHHIACPKCGEDCVRTA